MHTCVHCTIIMCTFLMWIFLLLSHVDFFVTGKSVGAVLFQLVNTDVSVTCGSVINISEGESCGESRAASACMSVRETERNGWFLGNSFKISTNFSARVSTESRIKLIWSGELLWWFVLYTLDVHKKERKKRRRYCYMILLVCVYVFLAGVKLYLLYHCRCKQIEWCAKLVSYRRGGGKQTDTKWTVDSSCCIVYSDSVL